MMHSCPAYCLSDKTRDELYENIRSLPEVLRQICLLFCRRLLMNQATRMQSQWQGGNPLTTNKILTDLAAATSWAKPAEESKVIMQTTTENESVSESLPLSIGDAEAAGCLILLAEDNEVNREVITLQLSTLGYTAMSACDGKQALKLWLQHKFALVLTDCHMPEMDGFELSQEIRKAETATGAHIPIIAVTANAMQDELQHCFDCGMDGCVTKPVELDVLGQEVAKWITLPE